MMQAGQGINDGIQPINTVGPATVYSFLADINLQIYGE